MLSPSSQTVIHNAGGAANSRPALGVSMGAWIARLAGVALAGLLVVRRAPALAQTVTPAGTAIDNVATVNFVGTGGTPTTITTNRVTAIVTPPPTLSAIAILRAAAGSGAPSMAGPTQCSSSSGMVTLPPPVQADGAALDPSQPIPLASTTTLHGGEAAFVRVMDADQNRDPAAVDYLDVRLSTPGGDAETLRLAETGAEHRHLRRLHPDPRGRASRPATACSRSSATRRSTRVTSMQSTRRDTSSASALVDPYGLIFDSRTGTPINGARVRLIDATIRLACGCCRRRRREQLSVGDADRLAGHRCAAARSTRCPLACFASRWSRPAAIDSKSIRRSATHSRRR